MNYDEDGPDPALDHGHDEDDHHEEAAARREQSSPCPAERGCPATAPLAPAAAENPRGERQWPRASALRQCF